MLVVDASVAVKFVAEENGSEQAGSLLRSSEPLIAPDWVLVEVGHALWKKARAGAMSSESAVLGLVTTSEFFQKLHSTPALLQSAYELAFQLNHWLYDCLYLELARRERTLVVTADEKFQKAAVRGGYGASVILLGTKA